MKIKICGIVNPGDADAAVEEGADFLGFIFTPGPRRADPRVVRKIVRDLPSNVEGVGVFRDQPLDEVRSLLKDSGLSIAQLHGSETPEFAAALGVRVIKTFTTYTRRSLEELGRYDCFAYLLDVPRGQTSRSHIDPDWAVCAKKVGRVIVAGGLTAENVRDVIRHIRPYGVDVCSWTDRVPGVKDRARIASFVKVVRAADRETRTVRVRAADLLRQV